MGSILQVMLFEPYSLMSAARVSESNVQADKSCGTRVQKNMTAPWLKAAGCRIESPGALGTGPELIGAKLSLRQCPKQISNDQTIDSVNFVDSKSIINKVLDY